MKKYLVLLWLLFLISGCAFQPLATPDFPYDLMLQSNDLPAGFVRTGSSFPEVTGGFSHLVGFSSNPDSIGKGISHQITVYPDIDSAKESLSKWENEWLTEAWIIPTAVYTPKDTEDQYILKCMDVQIDNQPSQSCTFLQQHNNLIILVLANIDNTVINYDQFIHMLRNLDRRLPVNGELIPMPSK